MLLSGKCQSEYRTNCIISFVWYSEKGKAMKTVNRSVFVMDLGSGDGQIDKQNGFFKVVKYSVCYCNVVYMTLCIFHITQNCQFKHMWA